MSRYLSSRRLQVDNTVKPSYDDDASTETLESDDRKVNPSSDSNKVLDDLEPFLGVKVRRRASLIRDYRGDYLDVSSRPKLLKILENKEMPSALPWDFFLNEAGVTFGQLGKGDKQVLFADIVLKFTGSGKLKRRTLLVTDFAIYIVDPDTYALKRRIALAAVEKICLSELSDNFFAIIIPTEYDILMASIRKTEIVTVLVDAMKSTSDYELDVFFANKFEYHAAADQAREVQFDEVEGGVKRKICNC